MATLTYEIELISFSSIGTTEYLQREPKANKVLDEFR
jgi:hypothetical protein